MLVTFMQDTLFLVLLCIAAEAIDLAAAQIPLSKWLC